MDPRLDQADYHPSTYVWTLLQSDDIMHNYAVGFLRVMCSDGSGVLGFECSRLEIHNVGIFMRLDQICFLNVGLSKQTKILVEWLIIVTALHSCIRLSQLSTSKVADIRMREIKMMEVKG